MPTPSTAPPNTLREALAGVIAEERRQWRRERELIEAQSREIVAELRAKIAELETDIRGYVADHLASLKDGRDGVPGRDGKDGAPGAPGKDGAPGRDGAPGPAGVPGERGAEGKPGPPGPPGRDGRSFSAGDVDVRQEGRNLIFSVGDDGEILYSFKLELPEGAPGKDGAPGRDGLPGEPGPAGPAGPPGRDGKDGAPGAPGKDGAPGRIDAATDWTDGVHYEGAVVIHGGATWQAVRDTGREPPHADWRCLARAGRDGVDGRSFRVRGTYAEGETYEAMDVVALGGASFAARRDNPGACPGDGWQLIAAQGKAGKPGERGAAGPRGERGAAGPPVVAVDIDDQGMLTLRNADGSTVTCDFYPVLAKIAR